jgi:hypothetical protein
LDDAYAGVPQAVLDAAAERGEALHRLCLTYLDSLDGVHEAPVPTPPYELAYQSFVKWCIDNAILVVAIEERSENTQFGYAGTPDAVVILQDEEVLIDLKFTASILRINKVQMMAYWKLDLYKTAKRAMLVHISPLTGELKVHPIAKHSYDWAGFLNALSVWKWRQI